MATKIYRNIITIYVIYIINILEQIKCLYKWQKEETFQVYQSSKKPRISVKTVSGKQNRNMDLQLELLETTISEQNSANLTNVKRRNKLQIQPRDLRNYKLMWDDLLYHFVFKTQSMDQIRMNGQTYTTLVFYRTILPNTKDTNAIQNQIICSQLFTVNAQEHPDQQE